MALEILWYLVIGAAMVFYTILDGFDLGVGSLHLFARTDEQRRLFLNSIGPVWDGNEVWIVIVIGGLFAGFPNVYASIFSGCYNLLMFLIAGLIFRACAIEFRSKQESPGWRSLWDVVFSISSILVAFVLGLLLGNAILGMPIDSNQNFVGEFSDFFHPYAILIGIFSVALFSLHGAIFLLMKTEGEAHQVLLHWVGKVIGFFLFWYAVVTFATLLYVPRMTDRFKAEPWLFIFPVLSLLAIGNIYYQLKKNNNGWAFLSSCASIFFLLVLYGLGTYPVLVLSTIDPANNSLIIFDTASSQATLKNLLIVVALGLPLVLLYMAYVYRVFHGKVKLHSSSY